MAANVYTTLGNATVYTDKLQIATGANAVTYQAYATALGSSPAAGNIYSVPITIPANTVFEVYSGAGNKVTVVGTPFTALELGTASSAQEGVIGGGA
jgi:hypothetical protein